MAPESSSETGDLPRRADGGEVHESVDPVSRIDGFGKNPPAADPDVTSREAATLRRAGRVARLLDEAIPVPGTDFRIGHAH